MKQKTDILDVATRKLAPYMFLFGLYLVSFGDVSPGGGFQGGVVISSGLILLAIGKDFSVVETLFPLTRLSATEAVAFLGLLALGSVGAVTAGGFLADFMPGAAAAEGGGLLPGVRFIFVLNLLIGVKVAAGVSLIFLYLFGNEEE